jgi:polyphosphate glucokinase
VSDLVLGIDIGGSGIKGAPVDIGAGKLAGERVRVETPQPSTPEAVAKVVTEVASSFPAVSGPVGVTFPAVVKGGVLLTAANVDKHWIGIDADALLTKALGRDVSMGNDADLAGVAEMRFGVGRDQGGVVIMVTLGTGIGTAVFLDGKLMPNTELGHLEVDGKDAETRAAASVRERKGLSFTEWAPRVETYLKALDALLWPDLFIIGGGVSRKADKFLPLIKVRPKVVPAELQNEAGIIGAALLAAEGSGS